MGAALPKQGPRSLQRDLVKEFEAFLSKPGGVLLKEQLLTILKLLNHTDFSSPYLGFELLSAARSFAHAQTGSGMADAEVQCELALAACEDAPPCPGPNTPPLTPQPTPPPPPPSTPSPLPSPSSPAPSSASPPAPPPPPPCAPGTPQASPRDWQSPHSAGSTPSRRHRMKTVNWSRLSAPEAAATWWREPEAFPEEAIAAHLAELDALFSVRSPTCACSGCASSTPLSSRAPSPAPSGASTPRRGGSGLVGERRALGVHVFLRGQRRSPRGLARAVRDLDLAAAGGGGGGDGAQPLGADALRALARLLPRRLELEAVKAFTGDRSGFSSAERLYELLAEVPAYDLRVRAMLLYEEFPARASEMERQLHTVITECAAVMNHRGLRKFLHLALTLGNHLNKESYARGALGFRLTDLPKLAETKANSKSPPYSFLHFVVKVALSVGSEKALEFADQLPGVAELSRISLDDVRLELKRLSSETIAISDELRHGPREVEMKYGDFMNSSKRQAADLLQLLTKAEDAWCSLASFAGEDSRKLSFEEGVSLLNTFLISVRECIRHVKNKRPNDGSHNDGSHMAAKIRKTQKK